MAFTSGATNLVPGDTNNTFDIFLRDMRTKTIRRISVGHLGAQANDFSMNPRFSGDGRFIVYTSDSSNIVPGDTNNSSDVFLHDQRTRTTELVNVGIGGVMGNGISSGGVISTDGRYVVFESYATNLVPGDTNNTEDVFLRDRRTGRTELVPVTSGGAQGNSYSLGPAVSSDGRYVAFGSDASNLVPGDTNDVEDVLLADRRTGAIERIAVSSSGAASNDASFLNSFRGDGRYIAFTSYGGNLVPGDTNRLADVFIRDRRVGSIRRVSIGTNGAQTNHDSSVVMITADARTAVFGSSASNLVPGDTNNQEDIFVWSIGRTG